MKNIGDKRKKRAKKVREKMITRREKQLEESKNEKKKAFFEYQTRRKQTPVRGQFNDPVLPLSQERKIVIDKECLEENYRTLKNFDKKEEEDANNG